MYSDEVKFSPNQKLPPDYKAYYHDNLTLWVAPDGEEGNLHWDKFVTFRGAWAHYRLKMEGDE